MKYPTLNPIPQPSASETVSSPAAALQTPLPGAAGPASLRTRIGKIARLPLAIREQLNYRLLDNERAAPLVSWLNALPEVQAMLAEIFAGRPITEDSIYEWKQGGFTDWIAHQNSFAQVRALAEQVEEMEPSKSAALDDHLASLILANLLRALQPGGQPNPQTLHALVADVQVLRRSSSQAARLCLDQQHLELERHRVEIESQRLALQENHGRFDSCRLSPGCVVQAVEEPELRPNSLPAPPAVPLLPPSTPATSTPSSGPQPE